MAQDKKIGDMEKDYLKDKSINNSIRQINNLLGQANLNIYGTDRNSGTDVLDKQFQLTIQDEIDSITKKDENDVTSFLNKLYSNDKKNNAAANLLDNQFLSMSGDNVGAMSSFIEEAHRNRLLEQSDLHEVASQLIELNEAILITRDSIISADTVEGRMSRTVNIENCTKDDLENYLPVIEKVEKKFDFQNKIKNFIVPKTLEFGSYYTYCIPYSKIFNDFMKAKMSDYGNHPYNETTVLEYVEDNENDNVLSGKKQKGLALDKFINDTYDKYYSESVISKDTSTAKPDKGDFAKDLKNLLGRITVCNESVPIPVMDEGFKSLEFFTTEYTTESGNLVKEAKGDSTKRKGTLFSDMINSDDGTFFSDDEAIKKSKNNFDDIGDCYYKLLDPMTVLPVKIMNKTIGYYYIQAEDVTPLSGVVSSTLFYSKFDEQRQERTVIDSIAAQIVNSFDKKFLVDNPKFKDLIVEAINYYNLNEKKLKFQFIPVEYITEYNIDPDEDGNGRSMIAKSLFYAKLYLMILLFKIMSIIVNSNDTKVNYIRTSGIDKNIQNKVQEIARVRQSRQINMIDLFNYTTLINKVGNGTECYIPTGRNNERPIETEILSGQDVQLNSDLLEMLKNGYILATGVPAAIVNYLNEADFAKVVEQNNTKYNGRVVNYQLDFNPSITEDFKKLLQFSTNLPDYIIENVTYTLQPPKAVASNAKAEAIGVFNTYSEFATNLVYGDVTQMVTPFQQQQLREFKKLLAQEQLPQINIGKLEDMVKEAKINAKQAMLEPNPDNGDNGDDIGISDEELDSMQQ